MTATDPVGFVDEAIAMALDENASDIYLVPLQSSYSVRIRIEGVQKETTSIPSEFGERCVARIKALAGLLAYRTSVAQDGMIRAPLGRMGSELRVATMPTIRGERVAIRISRGSTLPTPLDELGFARDVEASLRRAAERPEGLCVLTGPTGSGKTTTIYAMLRLLVETERDPASIITIEDPVERAMEGVSQSSISKDWSYADALRAALRQDVKTLVVGEMRDKEVVRVVLDAALTGHRVITTYHAGDIPSVFARLLHQGFEPFLIAAAVSCVVSQRLLPTGKGKPRRPVASVLEMDDDWRDFIATAPSLREIRGKLGSSPPE